MEKRKGKINISAAGGTAGKGARTCKLTLPTAWVDMLGIDSENREIGLIFDGTKITISRKLSGMEFAGQKLLLGHGVQLFRFYGSAKVCTTIYVDFTDETLIAENHIDNPVKTVFENNILPDWADFQSFLQERCVSRERAGLREYLESLGLAEYNPLDIIQRSGGRMGEDHRWLEMGILP